MVDRLAERISRIKAILADDLNYQADSLKIGAIWDVCDRAASYKRGKDTSGGDFIEVLPPGQSLSLESVRSEALFYIRPQIAHGKYGPEPSLREIIRDYYAFNGMNMKKAERCRDQYLRALQSAARVAEGHDPHALPDDNDEVAEAVNIHSTELRK